MWPRAHVLLLCVSIFSSAGWSVAELLWALYEMMYVEHLASCLTCWWPLCEGTWYLRASPLGQCRFPRLKTEWNQGPLFQYTNQWWMKKQDPNHTMILSVWNKCYPITSTTSTYYQKPAFRMCTTSYTRRSYSKQDHLIPPLGSKLIKYWKAHGPIFLHFWRPFERRRGGSI